jgi:hypothetical protein
MTGQTAWLLRPLRAFKVQADLDRLFLVTGNWAIKFWATSGEGCGFRLTLGRTILGCSGVVPKYLDDS